MRKGRQELGLKAMSAAFGSLLLPSLSLIVLPQGFIFFLVVEEAVSS
jgi:hypothetical protein